MHKDNHKSPLAVAYARALLELANESGRTAVVAGEMQELRQIIDATPMFQDVLADPAISESDREALLKRVFEGRVDTGLLNFLLVLNSHGRVASLAAIAGAFDDLMQAQLGRIEVDVTVAQTLDASQLEAVRQKIGAALKKDPVIQQFLDESIIGGMILRVEDQLIDGSVRTQLAQIRRQMQAAVPR